MKSSVLAALLCATATAGDIQQCWKVPFLDACVDNVSTSGSSHIRGHDVEHFVLISLTTQDYRVKGFLVDLVVQFEDGSVRHIYRENLPLPEKSGDPIVLKVSTGNLKPTKAVLFYVQRLIPDYATVLIPPEL